ncbi:ribokinase [mine drainage metagenome]|uniref:Ribokinase n=1 Tax=mine drainage metagenome TaxID=410659 RepID=A0A1J5QG34_9ZZZZ
MTPEQVDVAVVGSVNIDLVASVARLPLPGETVPAVAYDQFLGGKGSNQAIAAARLGRSVAFVGLIGDDREGASVRKALRAEHVDVAYLGTEPGVPTGRAIVLVDAAAENSIVVVSGANGLLSPRHIAAAADLLTCASVVVSQLEIRMETVVAAAQAAAGTFVLNPAPAQPLGADLLALVDVLVVNEIEYEVVTGYPLPEDPAEVARELAALALPGSVVVTIGSRGALVWEGAGVTHVPAPVVSVVDTTGAGDTFIGALADALSRGEALLPASRWAVHAAAVSVGALGATTGMPGPAEVLASVGLTTDPVPAVLPGGRDRAEEAGAHHG